MLWGTENQRWKRARELSDANWLESKDSKTSIFLGGGPNSSQLYKLGGGSLSDWKDHLQDY